MTKGPAFLLAVRWRPPVSLVIPCHLDSSNVGTYLVKTAKKFVPGEQAKSLSKELQPDYIKLI